MTISGVIALLLFFGNFSAFAGKDVFFWLHLTLF